MASISPTFVSPGDKQFFSPLSGLYSEAQVKERQRFNEVPPAVSSSDSVDLSVKAQH